MEYFEIYKHTPYLYQIKDALGSLSTLLIGSKKALVFDTCYGIGDLYKEIRNITNLPLIVVNSHGHMDHTNGNYQFDKVYINSKDYELCKKHNSIEFRKNNINTVKRLNKVPSNFNIEEYLNKDEGNLVFIDDLKEIDLGNIKLDVINTPGHTKGSISLYSKDYKLMLVSDAICQYIWLFLDESTYVSEYIETILDVLKYDFDYFLVGHGPKLIKKEIMYDYLNIAKNIDISKSEKVFYPNFPSEYSYAYTTNGLYNPIGCGIIYNVNKIKEKK